MQEPTKWEKAEIRALCRQYDQLRKVSRKNPQALADLQQIEQALNAIQGGAWRRALIENVCRGRRHELINAEYMPTSNRSEFYHARKEFIRTLWRIRKWGKT